MFMILYIVHNVIFPVINVIIFVIIVSSIISVSSILFNIQCCQSVIRKLVYGFMCRLDSSVNYIVKDILATSLQFHP